MNEWDASTFAEHLGKKIYWGMFTGRSFSGKKTVAAALAHMINGKIINMAQLAEKLRGTMGTDEEPFEGEVPIHKVEEAILEIVSQDRAANKKYTYLFDSWLHKTTIEFINAMHQEFGLPTFSIHCDCSAKVVIDRHKKKNEIDGDLGEEAIAEIDESGKKAQATRAEVEQVFIDANIKHKLINISTDGSLETTLNGLKKQFSAKVIIVNHEKRLDVDTTCSNLAIKYNMLYLSVYQLIKQQITTNTHIG